MRAWALIAVGVVLTCNAAIDARAAHAQDVGAAVRGGLGYDTNPVFLSAVDAATVDVAGPAAPSGYATIAGNATLASRAMPRLSLDLDGNARLYFTGGATAFLRLGAGVGARLGEHLLALAALEGTRFDTSFSGDAATTARARLGMRWTPREHLTLGLDASGGFRAYDTGDQLDALFAAGCDVRADLGRRARLSGGLDVERRESDVLPASRWELAPWMAATLEPTATVSLTASYTLYLRSFEVSRRSGVEHAARLEATWMPWRGLGLFASVEGGLARGNPEALRYERVDVLLGVRAALDLVRRASADDDPPAPGLAPDGPASAGARTGTVHFRVVAPGAARVSVIGTFDDWSEERGALRERAPGIFEADLAVAPGRHRYRLLIDGEPVRPPNSSRYVEDGFGGEDAVLEMRRD